ncbi:retrotrans_gag domain-containing protein [Trichonephila clavipes]|nr:retrotrans_gag domain-containing protein [Trichonephila clavipes]
MKQERVGRPRFERLPNVVPVASLTDETDLVSLIRTIVREEVHRLVNQTQESLDSDPQSLEEIVQDEVERVLAPVSTKPTETRPRPTYAAAVVSRSPHICFSWFRWEFLNRSSVFPGYSGVCWSWSSFCRFC